MHTRRIGTPPEAATTDTLVVLLAAGGGSRFTGPTHKLRADLGGESVAGAAIRHARDADVGPLLVVTGAVDLDDVVSGVESAVESAAGTTHGPRRITTLHHAGWADGQASSLRFAVAEAERRAVDAIVVGLADQPFIEPEAWKLVAAATAPIGVATYAGRRRNPVRLHRSIWPLLPTDGDEGARSVFRLRPELVQEVPCPGSPADIDTLEDLEPWQNRSSTNSP